MEATQLAQLALLAAAFLLLAIILIGSGIALQRSKNKKEGRRIAEEKQSMLSAPADPPAFEPAAQAAPDAGGSGPLEILRVYRDPVDAEITLRLMGQPAAGAADLSPTQLEQLKRVLAELNLWAGLPEGPGVKVAPQPAAHEEPPATPIPGSFAEGLPRPVELEDVLPFRRRKIPKLNSPPEPPKPIAVQIDEIVQRMLSDSALAGRRVRLSQDLHGGLRILDGARQYEAIDDIEDPQVQMLIKNAVREWNEKNRARPNQPGQSGN